MQRLLRLIIFTRTSLIRKKHSHNEREGGRREGGADERVRPPPHMRVLLLLLLLLRSCAPVRRNLVHQTRLYKSSNHLESPAHMHSAYRTSSKNGTLFFAVKQVGKMKTWTLLCRIPTIPHLSSLLVNRLRCQCRVADGRRRVSNGWRRQRCR